MTPLEQAVARIRARIGEEPIALAIVLGTGLGGLADDVEKPVAIPYDELPAFPTTRVSGHAGRLVVGHIAGLRVSLFQGREHYYEHGRADAMRIPIEAVANLGVRTLLLTNSAGSLDPAVGPASPMLITDHIAFSGLNPLIGEVGDERFVDMSEAYDPDLRRRFRDVANAAGIALAEGVYIWFSGPSFETPAEIRAARTLGADAVGMSTVPEVIIARRLGLRVAALSMITNLAAGLGAEPLDHADTKKIAGEGSERMRTLVRGLIGSLANDPHT